LKIISLQFKLVLIQIAI